MQIISFLFGLPVLASLASALPNHKRDILTDISLFAYGTNISGLSVVYGASDGLAYITASTSDEYLAVTWDIDSTGTLPLNATVNSTSAVSTFYIVPTDSAFESTGFVTNSTAPTGAVTTGFGTFGNQLVYFDNSTLLSQFWAETTDTDGVWAVKWNSASTSQDDSTPVTLKTTGLSTKK